MVEALQPLCFAGAGCIHPAVSSCLSRSGSFAKSIAICRASSIVRLVGLAAACAGAFAAYKSDLAAFYIALAWGTLTYMLHGLEFKLDKLLDLYGISGSPEEIAKD